VPDIRPRRRTLLASAATLPLLLATAGCRSSDVFTGPDPLAGRPRPAPDVITLAAVIAAASSRLTPWSLSTTTRSSRRLPAAVTRTDSRSIPAAVTTGSITSAILPSSIDPPATGWRGLGA